MTCIQMAQIHLIVYFYKRTCCLVSVRQHTIYSSGVSIFCCYCGSRQCYHKPSKSLKYFEFYWFKNVNGILLVFSGKCSTKEEINLITVRKGKYFERVITPYKKKILQAWKWEYNIQWNKDDFQQIYKGRGTVGLPLPFK